MFVVRDLRKKCRAAELRQISVQVVRRTQAAGLYRWPRSWHASFAADGIDYQLDLSLGERKTVSNWVIGGFSMGIAEGELRRDGEARRLYGLAELIL